MQQYQPHHSTQQQQQHHQHQQEQQISNENVPPKNAKLMLSEATIQQQEQQFQNKLNFFQQANTSFMEDYPADEENMLLEEVKTKKVRVNSSLFNF